MSSSSCVKNGTSCPPVAKLLKKTAEMSPRDIYVQRRYYPLPTSVVYSSATTVLVQNKSSSLSGVKHRTPQP